MTFGLPSQNPRKGIRNRDVLMKKYQEISGLGEDQGKIMMDESPPLKTLEILGCQLPGMEVDMEERTWRRQPLGEGTSETHKGVLEKKGSSV